MRKFYVFIYEHITLGGTQTLLLRMAKWLKRNEDCDVLIICKKVADANLEQELINACIEVQYVHKLNMSNIFNSINYRKDYKKIEFIVFQLKELLTIEGIQKKLNFKNAVEIGKTLYVVHPNGLKMGLNLKDSFIKSLIKSLYKKIIYFYINNRNMIFMDEVTIANTEEYYVKRIHNNDIIFRLPIELEQYNSETVFNRKSNEICNILTIARAEFPFKGYILGLIDDFKELCTVNQYVRLTVISHGPNIEMIKVKINQLPDQVREKINLICGVPYDQLRIYFAEATFFIGMGTTVLDAANHGLPVLTSELYTYENRITGYFHESPEVLGGTNDTKDAYEYMLNILNMSDEEYYSISETSYKCLKFIYGIDSVMNRFLRYKEYDNGKILSPFYLFLNTLFFKLIEIKTKVFNEKAG